MKIVFLWAQKLHLAEKDFKAAIISKLRELNEIMSKELKESVVSWN